MQSKMNRLIWSPRGGEEETSLGGCVKLKYRLPYLKVYTSTLLGNKISRLPCWVVTSVSPIR